MSDPDIPDARLIRQYLEDGREDAFAELVRRHLPLVYSAAVRQLGGDAHAAEDVAQAVFVEMARQAGRLVGHPTLAGWLHTTTRHLAGHALRRERRRSDRERKSHAMHDPEPDPPADWQRLRPVMDAALGELREPDRLALLLRYFEERDLRTVGRTLGISEDAARMRVDRALDRLGAVLRKRGITTTASALGLVLGAQGTEVVPASLAAHITATAIASAAAAGSGTAAALGTLGGTAAAPAAAPAVLAATSSSVVLLMKSPLLIGAAVAVLAAVPLVLQHQRVRALHRDAEALRAGLAAQRSLEAERERLRPTAARQADLERLRQETRDLERLQAEADALRATARSPAVAELARARAERDAARAEKSELEAAETFRETQVRRIEGLKHLGLAARIYATDHGDRIPRTFEAFAEVLAGALPEGEAGRTVAEFLEDYEFYPQPRPLSDQEPQYFLFREKAPRRSPEGRWHRAYGLVDGSVRNLSSPTEDFSRAEQEAGGIAPAEPASP